MVNVINAAIPATQYRVLIAGGCYGGLSAAINLLEKCDTIDSPISVDVTIVDERDGYCMSTGRFVLTVPIEHANADHQTISSARR